MATFYDPRHFSWTDWASLMCEAYGAQNLEIPGTERDWSNWAAGFVGIDLFAKDSMPNPYQYERWQDWATAVLNTLSVSGQ